MFKSWVKTCYNVRPWIGGDDINNQFEPNCHHQRMQLSVEILDHNFSFLVSHRKTLVACSEDPVLSPIAQYCIYKTRNEDKLSAGDKWTKCQDKLWIEGYKVKGYAVPLDSDFWSSPVLEINSSYNPSSSSRRCLFSSKRCPSFSEHCPSSSKRCTSSSKRCTSSFKHCLLFSSSRLARLFCTSFEICWELITINSEPGLTQELTSLMCCSRSSEKLLRMTDNTTRSTSIHWPANFGK